MLLEVWVQIPLCLYQKLLIWCAQKAGREVVVAEWLRRWIRNPLGSPRAGSSPADYGSLLVLKVGLKLYRLCSSYNRGVSLCIVMSLASIENE